MGNQKNLVGVQFDTTSKDFLLKTMSEFPTSWRGSQLLLLTQPSHKKWGGVGWHLSLSCFEGTLSLGILKTGKPKPHLVGGSPFLTHTHTHVHTKPKTMPTPPPTCFAESSEVARSSDLSAFDRLERQAWPYLKASRSGSPLLCRGNRRWPDSDERCANIG